MIKKLIRKLFGQDAEPVDEAAPAVESDDSSFDEPARNGRSPRSSSKGGAAPKGGSRRKPAAAAAPEPDAPVIISSDIHGIDPSLISRNAIRVTEGLQQAGFRAFIVGGAVRDLLLGIAP